MASRLCQLSSWMKSLPIWGATSKTVINKPIAKKFAGEKSTLKKSNQSQKHQVKVFTGGTINALTILDTVAELLPDCLSFEIREYDIRDLDYLTQATRYGISAVPAIVVDEELAYMGSHIKDSYKQTNSKEICRREKHPQKKQSSNKCALHGMSCQQIA